MESHLLRAYIRSVLTERATPVQGPPDGRFGKYVFADQRDDVPPEPNTPEEEELADALDKHYHGRPDELSAWIDDLLAHREDYGQFFDPPKRYKKAYRTMTVPASVFTAVMGREPTEEDMDGQVHVDVGASVGPYGGRNFFSWTLEPSIFYGLKKEWGSLFSTDWVRKKVGQGGFVMFLSAKTDANDFVLNPLKIRKTDIAGEFAYQMEVLGVGDIKLDDVSYFYFHDKAELDETSMIKDAIEAIE